MSERGRRKRMIGTVTSDKMNKTVVVEVERLVRHKKYDKTMRVRRKFKAHDENSEAKLGDKVEIIETRPLSKTKSWRVIQIIRKAVGMVDVSDEEAIAAGDAGEKEKSEMAPVSSPALAKESTAPGTEVGSDSKPDQA